jgi:cbb3-type cytochrome oxidase subunit 1
VILLYLFQRRDGVDRLASRFIKAALVYFVFGMILGAVLVFWPEWPGIMRTVHVHVNLLGWVPMVVYAAGYFLVPHLSGHQLHSPRMADLQFWLANAAVTAMIACWVVVAFQEPGTLAYAFAYSLLAFSALLMVLSSLLFAYNIWKTLNTQ